MYLWVDENKGQGLTIATSDEFNSMAKGETGALTGIGDMANVGQNGGAGEVTESPRLFTDGKGKLCVTYVAFTPVGSGSPSSAAWVQCSDDLGKSFAPPAIASPTYTYEEVEIGHPAGAVGPNGEIVV